MENAKQVEIFESTERAATQSVQETPTESDSKPEFDQVSLNDSFSYEKSQALAKKLNSLKETKLAQSELKTSLSYLSSNMGLSTNTNASTSMSSTSNTNSEKNKELDLTEKVFLYIFDQKETAMIRIRYADLAQEIGCSTSSLRRAIYKLRDKNLLEVESSAGRPGIVVKLTELAQNVFTTNDQNSKLEPVDSSKEIAVSDQNQNVMETSKASRNLISPQQLLNIEAESDIEVKMAASQYEERIKKTALKNLGLDFSFEKGRGGDFRNSFTFIKYFEMLLLLSFTILVNFIMMKSSAIYFERIDKIPGIPSCVIYIVLEAFIAYLSFTLGRFMGRAFILKILAILGLVVLSLALTVKGSIDSLDQSNIKQQIIIDRSSQIKEQIATLDERINQYLLQDWKTAAYKLEQTKMVLLNELTTVENKKIGDLSTSVNVKDQKTLRQQMAFVIILRIVLGLIGIFCCKKLGTLFFETMECFSFATRSQKKGHAYAAA